MRRTGNHEVQFYSVHEPPHSSLATDDWGLAAEQKSADHEDRRPSETATERIIEAQ